MKYVIKLWIVGVLAGVIIASVIYLFKQKDNSTSIVTPIVTLKTTCSLSSESLNEKVINKILSKKDSIKFDRDDLFIVESDSNDKFYIFKGENEDEATIYIGLTSYRIKTTNLELLKILNKVQEIQKLSKEKEDKEKILKAIGE